MCDNPFGYMAVYRNDCESSGEENEKRKLRERKVTLDLAKLQTCLDLRLGLHTTHNSTETAIVLTAKHWFQVRERQGHVVCQKLPFYFPGLF